MIRKEGDFLEGAVYISLQREWGSHRSIFLTKLVHKNMRSYSFVIYGKATPSPGGVGHFNGVGVVVRAVG